MIIFTFIPLRARRSGPEKFAKERYEARPRAKTHTRYSFAEMYTSTPDDVIARYCILAAAFIYCHDNTIIGNFSISNF